MTRGNIVKWQCKLHTFSIHIITVQAVRLTQKSLYYLVINRCFLPGKIAQKLSLEIFEFIMERAEDKNPKNEQGWTSLHHAAAAGHLEICKLICKNTSNLNPRTDVGMTPLHEAAMEGYLEICKLLVLKVEDKNPIDKWGFTPLHYAAREGYLEIYRFIADTVEDKNPEDGEGKTPLQLADDNDHYEICQLIYAYKIKHRDAELSNPEKKRCKNE